MFNNRSEIIRTTFIGLSILLCSIVLIITLYYLYHSRRKNLSLIENPPTNISKENEELKKPESQENVSPKLIEQLMRQSLELAKTAEKVADQNEKTLTLQDNIHFHL